MKSVVFGPFPLVHSRSVIILAMVYLVKSHLCGNGRFPPIQA